MPDPRDELTSMCDACAKDTLSDQVECCEACGGVFCPTCYEAHVTECVG